MNHNGLNQLLCAAVINNRFRETLLSNPAQAVAAGYYGHTFSLTSEERTMVAGIKARHLEDFAAQVHAWLSGRTETQCSLDAVPSFRADAAALSRPCPGAPATVESRGNGNTGKRQPQEAAYRRNGSNGRNGHLPSPLDLREPLGASAGPARMQLQGALVLA